MQTLPIAPDQSLRCHAFAIGVFLLSFPAFAATLVVTNNASLGPGTLRQALSDNLALGGGNTIEFSITGTITLQGELSVTAPVTISGPGADVLAVSGNDLSRVFTVTAGPVEISGLTIRNGRGVGDAGNQMQDGEDAVAGGIWNSGSLTLSNCVVLSNSVVGGLGGPRAQGVVGRGGRAYGGGIYHIGTALSLFDTTLIGNTAQGGEGGSAVNGNAGAGGDAFGGGIYAFGGSLQIVNGDFTNNVARGGDGGNSGGNGVGGAGGWGQGAGLYHQSSGSIGNSLFQSGSAIGGVGGNGQSAGGNGSGFGGGIYVLADLAVHSSTIANNTASGSASDWGGGIFNAATDFLNLTNCTISGNQADAGGGLYGSANLANTVLAGNSAGTGADAQSTITSFDYNLIQNTAGVTLLGATAHVLTGVNPLLGPLQDNGGPTRTMALLDGSPAIDQGNSFGLASDQRGYFRPIDVGTVANAAGGDGSDIGAFEHLANPPVPREFGVDVSHFQGESGVSQSSWDQMFAEDKRFAFIKATEGLTGPDDAAMLNNVTRATAAGLLAGVYHYAHPENRPTTNGAIQEADHFLGYAGNFIGPGYLRPVLDVEFSAAVLGTTELTDWVIAFCDRLVALRGSNSAPIIYCSQGFANNEFDSRLAGYDLWLRTIVLTNPVAGNPPGQGFADPTGVFNQWSFWQYSDSGASGGISPLDLNVCHSEFKPLDSYVIPPNPDPVKPDIAVPPQSLLLAAGATANFAVTMSVTSSPPLLYQWRFNETNIMGATQPTYSRPNVQLADAGGYTVVVTNAGGSVTSSVATLTVFDPITLYSEDFDGYSSPSVVTTNITTNGFKIFWSAASGPLDFQARFGFDYSTQIVPATIPSAPGSAGTTKGLALTVNKDASGAAAALNLYPVGQSFTGNVALKFDLWINWTNTSAATEHALFGINHSGDITNRVSLPTSDGLFFAMDGDGGSSSTSTTLRDYSVFRGGGAGASPLLVTSGFGPAPVLGAQFDHLNAGFATLFPSMSVVNFNTPAGSAGLGWVRVEVRQEDNLVTWLLNDTLVAQYTNTTAYTSGNILIGYNDHFNSIGEPANFAVFDNLRVDTVGPDYDADGLLDQWEVQFFGNLTMLPGGDADGDGATEGHEFLAGTNPTNAASIFRLLTPSIIGSDVQLRWAAVGGRSYVVQYQTNSPAGVTPVFTDLSPLITMPGVGDGLTNYLHVGGAAVSGGYYRIRLEP